MYRYSVLDLVVDEMDGRTRYLLRYGMVRYYLLWAEKGCLYVCVRARVHVCWAGRCCAGRCGACTCAGLGWAVLCCAVLVRCGAVLASLSESNEKNR